MSEPTRGGQSAENDAARIRDTIERSSLGTPEAKALRDSVSDEHAARIVKRAEELERELPRVRRLGIIPLDTWAYLGGVPDGDESTRIPPVFLAPADPSQPGSGQ